MRNHFGKSTVPLLAAMLALPAWGSLSAQQQDSANGTNPITVVGPAPADLTGLAEGPEVEGLISARNGQSLQVTTADGSNTAILVSEATDIRSSGGFLGLNRTRLDADSLLNGLPVTVRDGAMGRRPRRQPGAVQEQQSRDRVDDPQRHRRSASASTTRPSRKTPRRPKRCAAAWAISTSTISRARPTSTSTPASGR